MKIPIGITAAKAAILKLWLTRFSSSNEEVFYATAEDSSENVISVGQRSNYVGFPVNQTVYNGILVKHNKDGVVLFKKMFDQDTIFTGVAVDQFDNIYISGVNRGTGHVIFTKLDSNGSILFTKTQTNYYSGHLMQHYAKIITNGLDAVYIVSTGGVFTNGTVINLTKYDQFGTVQWAKQYRSTSKNLIAYDLALYRDNFYNSNSTTFLNIVGTSSDVGNSVNVNALNLAILVSNGTLITAKQHTSSNYDKVYFTNIEQRPSFYWGIAGTVSNGVISNTSPILAIISKGYDTYQVYLANRYVYWGLSDTSMSYHPNLSFKDSTLIFSSTYMSNNKPNALISQFDSTGVPETGWDLSSPANGTAIFGLTTKSQYVSGAGFMSPTSSLDTLAFRLPLGLSSSKSFANDMDGTREGNIYVGYRGPENNPTAFGITLTPSDISVITDGNGATMGSTTLTGSTLDSSYEYGIAKTF